MLFQIFLCSKYIPNMLKISCTNQQDKIFQNWQSFIEKKIKISWLKIKYSNHKFMDPWACFWPNSDHILMHNLTLLIQTRKSCWESILTLQNFHKNSKTVFWFTVQFREDCWFQTLAESSLNVLQPLSSPHTQRNGKIWLWFERIFW